MIKPEEKMRRYFYPIILFVPVIGMALGVGITVLFGIAQRDYANLIVNLFFLLACMLLLRIFQFSPENLGLKFIKERVKKHVFLPLIILALYIFFYIFVIRISSLKPISASTIWGLITFLAVVLSEELYFRGILYGAIEKRFSERAALIVTSIIFGLFHARQGMSGIVSRSFAGWLWGSIRYSSKMIFLLIPIHFVYNATWLLFEGSWATPPMWAIYVLPAVEFLLGLLFVITHDAKVKGSDGANN